MAAPPNSKARVAICQSGGGGGKEKKKRERGKNNTISVKQAHRPDRKSRI